jgi:hypothetical protein
MLMAYFDESGVHHGEHLCVVAGFIGGEDEWLAFANEWVQAIRPRKNLHMRNLRWKNVGRVGPLLERLGPIPFRHHLQPIYAGVWWSDYDAVAKDRVRESITNPWILAAEACMIYALKNTPRHEKLSVIFDLPAQKYRDEIGRLFDVVFRMGRWDRRLSQAPNFRPQNETVAIDPADYLAFQVREYYADPKSPQAKLGMPIMAGVKRSDGHILSRAELDGLVRGAWPAQGMVKRS